MIELPNNYHQDFLDAANTAYHWVAQYEKKPVETIAAGRYCFPVSAAVMDALFDINRVYEGVIKLEERAGWEVQQHRYLKVAGNDIVLDPTWQQFVPESSKTEELPLLLTGSRIEVVEFAAEHGVSEVNQRLWLPIDSSEQPTPYLTPAQRIAEAVDRIA